MMNEIGPYPKISNAGDKYAIDGKPEDFNMVSVRGVRDFEGEIEECRESPEFFSVYLRHVEGGSDCIGDFLTVGQAIDYAKEISEKWNCSLDLRRVGR